MTEESFFSCSIFSVDYMVKLITVILFYIIHVLFLNTEFILLCAFCNVSLISTIEHCVHTV